MIKISSLAAVCASVLMLAPPVYAHADGPAPDVVKRYKVARTYRSASSGQLTRQAVSDNIASPESLSKISKKPSLVLANDVTLLGWLGYTDLDMSEGLYEFTPDGYSLRWIDPNFEEISNGWELGPSWLNPEGTKICGYANLNYYGWQQGAAYIEYALEDGQILTQQEFDIETVPVFSVAAYNSYDGYIYGFGFDIEGNPFWGKASASEPTAIESVREFASGDPLICSLTYCPADNLLYAVTADCRFISFDSNFKMTEIIPSLGVENFQSFVTGLCYSEKDNVFYWNANAKNPADETNSTYKSFIYSINIATKEVKSLLESDKSEEFISLYVPVSKVADDVPLAPEFVASGFAGGSLSGDLTFLMPSATGNGTPIQSEMTWEATVDGVKVAEGKASASEEVKVSFAGVEQGNRQFGFTASLNGKTSRAANVRLYIGNDTPLAPANVTIAPHKVSWDAVTAGVNDGFIDTGKISYEVSVNGKIVGTFTSTVADVEVADLTAPYAPYVATVVAVCNGMRSDEGKSPRLLVGKPFDLDLEIRPTAAQADLCMALDGNGDGMSWILYDESDDSYFRSQYSTQGDADDYLIIPAINFPDKDAYYEFSLETRARRASEFPEEYIEVRMGQSPEIAAMTEVLVEKTKCTDTFTKIKRLFSVPQSGTWYVAVRCCSAYDQYDVYVKNIKVSKTVVTDDSPAEPTEIVCTPGAKGALTATVEFTLPSVTMTGTAIPAGTQLEGVVRSADTVKVTGAPGQRVSATVKTVQGDNKVFVSANDGVNIGLVAETSVYTGIDSPGLARNVKASVQKDNITVDLTWDAPDEGANGGYVVPEDVYYEIYLYGPGGWMKQALLGKNERTYRYVADDLDGNGMAIVQLGVRCINSYGANPMVSIGTAIIGTPYSLPMEETFDRTNDQGYQGPDCGPSMMLSPDDSYTSDWGYFLLAEMNPDWAGLTGGALVCQPRFDTSKGRILLPKVSTEVKDGETVELVLRSFSGSFAPQAIRVYGMTYEIDEPVLIAELQKRDTSTDWTDYNITLPATLVNRAWIQPVIDVDFSATSQLLVLDSYKLHAINGGAVDEIASGNDSVTVKGMQGEVMITGAAGRQASVFTPSGVLVTVSSDSRIALPAGIYLVKIAGKVSKVVVR